MFFFIGGIQPKTVLVDRQARTCPACGHLKVFLKRVDNYVSVFFIPLFPVKRGTSFLTCENCNTIFDEHGSWIDVERTEDETRCLYCGRSLGPDFIFCPYCGKTVNKRK